METDKARNLKEFLLSRGFTEDQRDIVIALIDSAREKLIDEILTALEKKKIKLGVN